jgi:hypothetical protein
MIIFDRNLINQLIVSLKNKIMEENKEDAVSKITANKTAVAATPKPRKPRVSKSTKEVGTTAEIHVAEENQLEPFLEEAGSLIELEPKKDKKKKKNKKKEKEKKKAKKAKEKAKAKAKKAKKAKKEKAKKAKVKAKAKEKKAKAKAKKAKKNKKNKSKKK